ncbi:MAG TPA: DUF5667 domain-containing protein [Actinomycetota bacterium]|nr:DUF5667 domain-containing protein [Actinomycetota bacterium]
MSPEDALDQALDQALDALLAGTPGTTAMSGLAGLAGAVRAAVATEPSPQTRARHQRVLMDEAARLAGPQAVAGRQGAAVRPRRLRRRLVAVAAVLAALIVVGAPASAALAANAQPGQALYSIKLATENVELAFQRNPQKKVALRLKFAEERIAEMTTLVARGRTGQVPGVATRLASEQNQVDAAISGLQASGKAPAALLRSVIRMLADHARKLSALAQSSGCGLHPRTAACRQLLRARAGTVRLARRVAQAAGVAPPT